jgi:hypothetical protein
VLGIDRLPWRRGIVPASQFGVCLAWGLNQLALLRTFKRMGWQLGCRILCHFGPLWLGEALGIDVVVMAGRRIWEWSLALLLVRHVAVELVSWRLDMWLWLCCVVVVVAGVAHLLMLAKRAPGNITSPRCSNRSHQETSETDSNQKQAFSNRR